jgi:hypothetical protein
VVGGSLSEPRLANDPIFFVIYLAEPGNGGCPLFHDATEILGVRHRVSVSPRFFEGGGSVPKSFQVRNVVWVCILLFALLSPAERQLYASPAIVLSTATLIMTLGPGVLIYRLLTLPPVQSLGLISYSLYLWHWSVLSISRWTIGIHWWWIPLQIGTILGLSIFSYVFLEKPLRRAQWSSSKLLTIGFGLIVTVCAAGIITLLRGTIALYTGVPVHFDGIGIATLVADKSYYGKIEWHANAYILI